MRLRLLDRYLLATFLRIFGISVVSAPLLFVLADITGRLDGYLARGLTTVEIIMLYPPQVPTYVAWAFPIAALVATLFTLQPLAQHGEVLAAIGCGVPVQRLFLPLLAGGALASLFAIVLLEAAPALDRRVASDPVPAVVSGAAQATRGPFAYRTDAGDFLSAQRLDVGNGGRMQGVVLRSVVDELRDRVEYVVAEEASWYAAEGWVLERGNVWVVDSGRATVAVPFARLVRPGFNEAPQTLLEAHSVDPSAMSFADLGEFADRLERSGSSANYPRVKQWERITIPLITLVIIAFAAPLAMIAGHGKGQSGAALALLSTIGYLTVHRMSEGLGIAGILEPALATSLPALLFGSAAVLLLRRART